MHVAMSNLSSARQRADAGRNRHVHGLRGALAFSLFLFHVVNSGLPTFDGTVATAAHFVLASMEHGVELFFGISGIVIVFAYRKAASPMKFLRDRALRIFPVLWVTVALIALLSRFDARHALPLDALTFVANLFALPPSLPFRLIHPAAWSISYEFVFYLSFVLFGLLAAELPHRVAVAAIAVIGAVLVFTHARMIGFVIGMAIAVWAPDGSEAPGGGRRRSSAALDCSGLLLLVSLLAWSVCYELLPPNAATGFEFIGNPAATAVFVLAVACAWAGLAGVYGGRGAFARWMCLPVMQWLGTISFSLYLWQTVVMALVKGGMVRAGLAETLGPWSQLAFFALALPPTLLVSQLSQRWIEDRLTRWVRGRLVARKTCQPVLVEGANHVG